MNLAPAEKETAWKEGKAMAATAMKARSDKQVHHEIISRRQRAQRMFDQSKDASDDDKDDEDDEDQMKTIGGGGEMSSSDAGGSHAAIASQLATSSSPLPPQVSASLKSEARKSKIFNALKKQRALQREVCEKKFFNVGVLRQQLEHIFRIACSHGADLDEGMLSCSKFILFVDQLGVTTNTPYDQFEPQSSFVIRDKIGKGEERVVEVQLYRISTDSLSILFDYASNQIGNVIVNTLGASSTFQLFDGGTTRLSFVDFCIACVELLHRMVPDDYYPDITKHDTHCNLMEAFLIHGFGEKYVNMQVPTLLNDFHINESMCIVIGESYQVLADVFLYCIAPSKFNDWNTDERVDRYIRIGTGEAFIEYESINELVKKLGLPHHLLSAQPMYDSFSRYDVQARKDRVVVDFAGFTIMCAHMSFSVFLLNAAYPTPQAKFSQLIKQYFIPMFPPRQTIPPPLSAAEMPVLEAIKPDRAGAGIELWVFGDHFPVRTTINGNRCALYVKFGEVVVKGACMSATVGNIVVPRLHATEDTVMHVAVAPGEDVNTFNVVIHAKTIYPVSVSNDRLRWTKSSRTFLSYEDVLASYPIKSELVDVLKQLFAAFGQKGADYEDGGEIKAGKVYLTLRGWSRMCQMLPLCVDDDGDPTLMISRHARFFENAKARLDALDISAPVLNLAEFINLLFKQFLAQYGPDERLVEYVTDALKQAPNAIDVMFVENRPTVKKKGMSRQGVSEQVQKQWNQLTASVPPVCSACGLDPAVSIGHNPFDNLVMIREKALPTVAEPLDVFFLKASAAFIEQSPKDPTLGNFDDEMFAKMSIVQAEKLGQRGKYAYLTCIVQRLVTKFEQDAAAIESRFDQAIAKVKTHSKFVAHQSIQLQQMMEVVGDAISRVLAMVVEHENLTIEERKMRVSGMLSQSDTLYSMSTQLYQGLKATLNATRDLTRGIISEEDDSDELNTELMNRQAVTFREHLKQQIMHLEDALKLRLQEIRDGPTLESENSIISGLGQQASFIMSEESIGGGRDNPFAAAARRMSSVKIQGATDEEVQKKLDLQKESMELAFKAEMKELERRRDQQVKECTTLLQELLRYTQEEVDIPPGIANPCFKYLFERGSQLKRVNREAANHGAPGDASMRGGGGGRYASIMEENSAQTEEDQLPSMLQMQADLKMRGIDNAAKIATPAVLLRKGFMCVRDVLGKNASNAQIYSDFSKILKFELQNILNPRTRDLITVPKESELTTNDALVNTLLVLPDFDTAQKYVEHELQLEQLVVLTSGIKELNKSSDGGGKKSGKGKKDTDRYEVPVPVPAPLAGAIPPAMLTNDALRNMLKGDDGDTLQERVCKRLSRQNMALMDKIAALETDRCKTIQTDPPPPPPAPPVMLDFSQTVDLTPPPPPAPQAVVDTEPRDIIDMPTKVKKSSKTKEKSTPTIPPKEVDDDEDGADLKSKKSKKASDPVATPKLKSPIQSKSDLKEAKATVTKQAVAAEAAAKAKVASAVPKKMLTKQPPAALESPRPEQWSPRDERPDQGDVVVADEEVEAAVHDAIAFAGEESVTAVLQAVPQPAPTTKARTAIEEYFTGKTVQSPKPKSEVSSLVSARPPPLTPDQQSAFASKMKDRWEQEKQKPPVRESDAYKDDDDDDQEEVPVAETGPDSEESSRVGDTASEDDGSEDEDEDDASTSDSDESIAPNIALRSDQQREKEEELDRAIGEGTARLASALEDALKSAPESAALLVELQGVNDLVFQQRKRLKDVEDELDSKKEQIKGQKTLITSLQHMLIRNAETNKPTFIVKSKESGQATAEVTEKQIAASRLVLAERDAAKLRCERLLKKYGKSTATTASGEARSTGGSGLLELTELLEEKLRELQQDSANRADARRKSSIVDDCREMLQKHFPESLVTHEVTQPPEKLAAVVEPLLSQLLFNAWHTKSSEAERHAPQQAPGISATSTETVGQSAPSTSGKEQQGGTVGPAIRAAAAPKPPKPLSSLQKLLLRSQEAADERERLENEQLLAQQSAAAAASTTLGDQLLTRRDSFALQVAAAQRNRTQAQQPETIDVGAKQQPSSAINGSPDTTTAASSAAPPRPFFSRSVDEMLLMREVSEKLKFCTHETLTAIHAAVSTDPNVREACDHVQTAISSAAQQVELLEHISSIRRIKTLGQLATSTAGAEGDSDHDARLHGTVLPAQAIVAGGGKQQRGGRFVEAVRQRTIELRGGDELDDNYHNATVSPASKPLFPSAVSSHMPLGKQAPLASGISRTGVTASTQTDLEGYLLLPAATSDADCQTGPEEKYTEDAATNTPFDLSGDGCEPTPVHQEVAPAPVEAPRRPQPETASASAQTEKSKASSVGCQCDENPRQVFLPTGNWLSQLKSLRDALVDQITLGRTSEEPMVQFMWGMFHLLRSLRPEHTELASYLYSWMCDCSKYAHQQVQDFEYCMWEMMKRGAEVLNDACGRPLSQLPSQRAGVVDAATALPTIVDAREVNHLLQNLLFVVDHRVAQMPDEVKSSQRSMNRWRVFILSSLLETAEGPVAGFFSAGDRAEMMTLVEKDELTSSEQRRLFFLQALALSLLIFSQYRHGSFVTLAMKLKLDTPAPLSLHSASTSYLRMARDAVLQALVPQQYNDLGTVDMFELSAMTKQFVAKVLSFNKEEYAWLSLTSIEKRTKAESLRLSELQDILERLHKLNPSKTVITPATWIECMSHVVKNLLGPISSALPSWMTTPVAPPQPRRLVDISAKRDSADDGAAAGGESSGAPVPQPSSLEEPPSFLRDMQWIRPSAKSSSFGQTPPRQHDPVKCETPPPQSTCVKVTGPSTAQSASKVVFGGGKTGSSFSLSGPGVRSNSVVSGSTNVTSGASPLAVAQHGGSFLGRNSIESFSASSIGGGGGVSGLPVISSLFGAAPSTIKPLSHNERKELEDLRQLCGGGMPAASISQRSFRAWMELELRHYVSDQRSLDLDGGGSVDATRELVQQSLRKAGASSSSQASSIVQSVASLSNAQARVFVQQLRGISSILPALE